MADASHLERMGRELKCPICLSLLDSAVSLVCNHVFCNVCVMKSMKSGLNCPVCKVPYRRREVRPAPHMDNLVSIYKNMEIASGMSIFVSQNPATAKLSDEGKKDVENNHPSKIGAVPAQDVSMNSHKTNKGGSRKAQAFDLGQRFVQLSRPTKKRIRVPEHPPFTAPMHIENAVCGSASIDGNKAENSLDAISQKTTVNENGDPLFLPFFWLRDDKDEDDVEEVSQYSDKDQLADSSPPKTPCFSDIKDADDDVAVNSMAVDSDAKANPLELYDSELFEWTQRPCSPELCSSPLGNQLADASARNMKARSLRSCAIEGTDNVQLGAAANKATPIKVPSHVDESNFAKSAMSKKRGRKAGGKLLGKSACTDINQPATVHSKEMASIGQTMLTSDNTCDETLDNVDRISIQKAPETQEDSRATNMPTSKSLTMRKTVDGKKRIFTVGQKELRPRKRRRFCSVLSVADVGGNKKEPSSTEVLCNFSRRVSKNSNKAEKSRPLGNNMVLQKCGTISKVVQCAFCHSSECSQASGEMVTYRDGILVAVDCQRGSKVMHVHRNCAEWAPNVYFDDDKAINLDAELARGRRISCGCCGIKGAALGCFEKSCRKSFHVTCAKLMPQCRWDNVNFVMLCPLHKSSKLPIEISTSQDEDIGKSSSSKEKMEVAWSNVTRKDHKDTSWNQSPRRSYNKMVLCCSSLTNAERDIVSEFVKESRAVVLPKWYPSVTHVIASLDENKAYKRTLKVLMGILEGKWILSLDWIQACVEAKEHVDEEKYEINLDTHGIKDGPRLGRMRVLRKIGKLFEGMEFYFTGGFVPSYRGYLQDLVTAAGGTVLHRKPIPGVEKKAFLSPSALPRTFIIYSQEVPRGCDPSQRDEIVNRRKADAEALASSSATKFASNSWLLDSIAAYQQLPL